MQLNEPEYPVGWMPSVSSTSVSEQPNTNPYDNTNQEGLKQEYNEFLASQHHLKVEVPVKKHIHHSTHSDYQWPKKLSHIFTASKRLQALQSRRLSMRAHADRHPSFNQNDILASFQRRFSHLSIKSDIVSERLQTLSNLEAIKNLAVSTLDCVLVRQLQVIYNSNVCKVATQEIPEIPYRVFSWSIRDYQERRKLTNNVWIDVLMMDIPEDCLNVRKLNHDLEELFHHVQLIFNAFHSQDTFDIDKAVTSIDEAYDFLNIYEMLQSELIQNRNTFQDGINKSLASTLTRNDPKQREFKLYLEEKLMNYDVWSPIEMRYQLNYYGEKINQSEYRAIGMVKKFTDEINFYEELLKTEKYCAQCGMDTYYTMIEQFKAKISTLNAKYDQEYETVDNDISYMKLSMEKLREQKLFFQEQIVRFHEEIEELRLREIREHELELKRQQELEERGPEIKKKGKRKAK